MTTTAAKILTGLFARITPSGQSVGGKPTIGSSGPTTKDYPLANIVSAFKVVAAASSNVATLTLSTGVVAQTTGSPVITDGDGKDLEGDAADVGEYPGDPDPHRRGEYGDGGGGWIEQFEVAGDHFGQ
jgi:hypothetical protein